MLILVPVWSGSIEEFEAAVAEGALEERHDFDAKRQLPGSGKELAKDIAAMSTDGGALVYGIGEDEGERPRVLAPLAPHQVSVGNDRRYYGRCETGNRILTEAEIARLYDRRARLNVDRERLLSECIAASPAGPSEPGRQGFLQAFAQPALRDDELWDRAVEQHQCEEQILQKRLGDAVASVRGDWGGAHIGLALNWRLRGADKWTLDTGLSSNDPDSFPVHRRALADLSMDGRCYMFYGGAADTTERRSPDLPSSFLLYERGIALNLAQFMALVGGYYKAGAQHGPVDVGMAVTGIRGAISAHAYAFERPACD